MTKQFIATERGSTILGGLFLASFVAGIAYLLIPYFQKQKSDIKDLAVYQEAKFLAEDVMEIGKYLMLYERIIYVDKDGPFNLPPGTPRRENLVSLWSGNFSEGDDLTLLSACGGFDGLGKFLGTFMVEGAPVFCPLYVRSSLFNGKYLEKLYFERIVADKKPLPFEKIQEGHYRLTLNLFDSKENIDSISGNNGYFSLNAGQSLFSTKKAWLDKISIAFDFYTDSSGFVSNSSRRYLQIRSSVEIGSKFGRSRMVEEKFGFSIATPTPKLFSLFVPYPMTSDNKLTRKFSESIKIHPDSNIYGKIYFNGDIDLPLSELPTFHETVIISGNFTPPLGINQKAEFDAKFRKGVITKFSASRFLMSGKCSTDDLTVANMTGLNCRQEDGVTDVTINDYVNDISTQCTFLPVEYDPLKNNGKSKIDCGVGTDPRCTEDAPGGCVQTLISGVFEKVKLSGPYSFVFSTISKLTSEASIVYGSILGGHMDFGKNPVTIKSQQQWKIGDPGIGSPDVMKSWNDQASMSYVGITVPLSSFPLVYLGE